MEIVQSRSLTDMPTISQLEHCYLAAGRRLLAAQQEKMEATTEFLIARERLGRMQSEQGETRDGASDNRTLDGN